MNRGMPNGTYGGVRGEKKNLPYSIVREPLIMKPFFYRNNI